MGVFLAEAAFAAPPTPSAALTIISSGESNVPGSIVRGTEIPSGSKIFSED